MARRKVIEWLIHRLEHEVDDSHFSMGMWLQRISDGEGVLYRSEKNVPYCKTAGCMAGTLFLGLPAKVRKAYASHWSAWHGNAANIELAGQEQMGLTPDQSDLLFTPHLEDMSDITRQDAVAVLKRMLTHSEINWVAAVPELTFSWGTTPLAIELTDD